jgi:hypothetical protein
MVKNQFRNSPTQDFCYDDRLIIKLYERANANLCSSDSTNVSGSSSDVLRSEQVPVKIFSTFEGNGLCISSSINFETLSKEIKLYHQYRQFD